MEKIDKDTINSDIVEATDIVNDGYVKRVTKNAYHEIPITLENYQ